MKKRKKAARVVTHTLADGTVKQYRYASYERPRPNPRFDADSIEALIRQWRRSPEWNLLKPATQDFYTRSLRPLEKSSHCAVRDVSRRDLLTIRDGIASGRGNGAAQSFIRAASALFGFAVDHDWISISPVHRIKQLPHGEIRAWTAEEADRAQAELPEPLRRVVILARYTGQRRADLTAMLWSAFDGQRIRVKQQKTGTELVIPCHPALLAELATWPRDAVTILTNAHGRPWRAASLSNLMPIAMANIGMPGLSVHGLRKLCAAELAEAEATEKEIAAVTGHKTLAMVQLYTKSANQPRLADSAILKFTKHTNRK